MEDQRPGTAQSAGAGAAPVEATPKAKAFKLVLPPYITLPEDLAPFGVKVGDIMMTPLGLKGTVMGARVMLDPATGENQPPRVWVRYSTGLEAPLEPLLGSGPLTSQGYVRCHTAEHILRDSNQLQENYAAWEERERNPPPPPPEKGKDGKDAKGKKK